MMSGGNAVRTLAAAAMLVATACKGDKDASKAAPKGPVIDSTAPGLAASANGFKTPESVRYDSANDVFYVSNINRSPVAKNNNGFLSRVKPDGTHALLFLIAGRLDCAHANASPGPGAVG